MSSMRRFRSPTSASTPRTAALATEREELLARLRVGSCGLRGRPYTSGWATGRENEVSPPSAPFAAAPYSPALTPCDLSWATGLCARVRSPVQAPNLIESVGHAF